MLFGAEGELIEPAALYIKGLGCGMIPTMVTQVLMIYIRLNDGAKLSFISVICMTVTNITLDIVFTIVLGWGMLGMGIATSISYFVAMLVCCLHFFKKSNIFRLSSMAGGGKELVQVVLVGLPSALNRACMSVRSIALNYLLISLGGAVAVSALVIVFAHPIVSMFLHDSAEGMALAVRSLRFFCLSLPLSLVCVVLINFYQCTKNLILANIICIGHGLAFVVAVSFSLSPVMGTDAVWISFLCSEILTVLTVTIYIRVRTGKFPLSWARLTLLPEDFDYNKERILDISIRNDMDQVVELSTRIHEFCNKYTQDSKKVDTLALCIEEMAGNIVQHGFRKDKEQAIDIRIIMDEDSIIFRIRDNGIPFNPIKYADENSPFDGDNLGITMVRGLVKDMSYYNAVSMNNLTIVI